MRDVREYIANHDNEVIERYLEDISDKDFMHLVADLYCDNQTFKTALFEAVANSHHLAEAQEHYLTIANNETPDHRDA